METTGPHNATPVTLGVESRAPRVTEHVTRRRLKLLKKLCHPAFADAVRS